ncbi:alcohol dehydrogenase catalytic domain-containing protein [Actinosynnema mirum]|uniref:alcohol dehydrogenase catalytic domain-containing protein n=1 Tax=Actinosynnema mirum TaxID=40567 RepID=UPI00019AC20A|nr:alcohol dehydrogenase catalytic domain-containing protein [Actinosynnema mirum]
MRAVVWHGVGDIRLDEVPDPKIIGHGAVGVVEEVGPAVHGFTPGDRVVVTSTIGCGTCAYCRAGCYAQCDTANPNGPDVETVDHTREDPVALVKELTGGIGVDRVIDAVGVDAERPKTGPAAERAGELADAFERERAQAAPDGDPSGPPWAPGDAPSQALRWAVEAVATAGSIGIVGVSGAVDPTALITRHEDPVDAVAAHESFDRRDEGRLKTVLDVA